jgi:hypothetical protein
MIDPSEGSSNYNESGSKATETTMNQPGSLLYSAGRMID